MSSNWTVFDLIREHGEREKLVAEVALRSAQEDLRIALVATPSAIAKEYLDAVRSQLLAPKAAPTAEELEYRRITLTALANRYGDIKLSDCAEWVLRYYPGVDKALTLREAWKLVNEKVSS